MWQLVISTAKAKGIQAPPSDTNDCVRPADVVDLRAVGFDGVFRVRRAEQADYVTAAEVLLRSRHASVPVIPPLIHTDADAKKHFVETVMPSSEVWVAEVGQTIVGVLVLNGNSVEQLYVGPDWFAQGIGSALLEQAKIERPKTLELWTFESNAGARRFYERHGFSAVGGTKGDNEEGSPDILYKWTNQQQTAMA